MWLTVKPPVSIHCADSSLYNFPSSVRKGMAVSTITAVKAGLLLFFLDRRQPGTEGDATPIKVYFHRFSRGDLGV